MSKFPGFCGGSYADYSAAADAQTTVNLFPQAVESGQGKSKVQLIGTPGLELHVTLPHSPIRGLWAGEHRVFAAAGSKLYEIFADGSYNLHGDIGDDSDHSRVYFYPNGTGTELMVVSAGLVWRATGVTVEPAEFEDGTQVQAQTGAFLDATFFADGPQDAGISTDPRRFYISAPNDSSSWDMLDFAAKEGYADRLAAVLHSHEDLWLWGSQTIEVWRAKIEPAVDEFPFERDPGAFIHQGVFAVETVSRFNSGVAWLGGDPRGGPIAYWAQGYVPVRISDHAVEAKWKTYSQVDDARSFPMVYQGHLWWVITFPSGNATWVYDATTKVWFQWAFWDGSAFDRHRISAHCYGAAADQDDEHMEEAHLIGDHTSGNIYRCAADYLDDDGDEIMRERSAPHLSDEHRRTVFSSLELVQDTADAGMELSWSNDGGVSFSTGKTPSLIVSDSGKLKRSVWRRLGQARDRIFRLRSSAAIRQVWVDAYLEAGAGF